MTSYKTIILTLTLSATTSALAGTFVAGENERYDTEDLRKISFDGDKVTAEWLNGNTKTYDLSSMQRILFSEPTQGELTEAENQMANQGFSLLLYPNPVNEVLFISGIPEGANVELLNSNGSSIKPLNSNGTTLQTEVSELNTGIYFVKVNNKVVKFIKK